MFSRGNYENANGVEREIALSMSCLGGNKSNHNQFDKQNQLSNKSKHLRMQSCHLSIVILCKRQTGHELGHYTSYTPPIPG